MLARKFESALRIGIAGEQDGQSNPTTQGAAK